jgi:hypothetical protein
MRRRFKSWLFNLVRPLFVYRVDAREDYVCCVCGEPVLRRVLTCGPECSRRLYAEE